MLGFIEAEPAIERISGPELSIRTAEREAEEGDQGDPRAEATDPGDGDAVHEQFSVGSLSGSFPRRWATVHVKPFGPDGPGLKIECDRVGPERRMAGRGHP